MLSFIKGSGLTFHEATFTETHEALDNPGRGWYRIYTYRLGEEAFEAPVRYENETLAMVLMNIGAFKDRDLDEGTLSEMDRIMECFEKLGLDLILRICYDTEGKGMVREPSLFSQVKKHLVQAASVAKKHAGHVCVWQGLLVGNWGEMHGSRYLIPKCIRELTELFFETTEEKIPLAFRKPVQYRMAFSENEQKRGIGFFNDGMLGSDTHMGTFGPETDGKGSWQEPWGIQSEMEFMKEFQRDVPYGGEVLMPPPGTTCQKMEETLRALKVSYLNSTHDAALLEQWKKTEIGGSSLYHFIGERLGYRFLVKKVQEKIGRNLELTLEIENTGYANVCEDAGILITAVAKGMETERFVIGSPEGNLKELEGGKTITYRGRFDVTVLGGLEKKQPVDVYASIVRKRDKRRIRFAQECHEGELLLGTIKKN